MVRMELTLLGSVSLRASVVRLVRPLDSVSHSLHNGHDLNELDIEDVLKNTSAVYIRGRVLT